MFKKSLLAAALTLAATFGANATTTSSTFTVNLTINPTCSVSSPNNVNFGSTNAATTTPTLQATASFTVACSNTTPFTVGLQPNSTSTAANAGTGVGNMTGPGAGGTTAIAYQLFSNSAYSTVWGNKPGTNTLGGTGSGMANALTETVYAQVTGSIDVAPGTYGDTVTINVNY